MAASESRCDGLAGRIRHSRSHRGHAINQLANIYTYLDLSALAADDTSLMTFFPPVCQLEDFRWSNVKHKHQPFHAQGFMQYVQIDIFSQYKLLERGVSWAAQASVFDLFPKGKEGACSQGWQEMWGLWAQNFKVGSKNIDIWVCVSFWMRWKNNHELRLFWNVFYEDCCCVGKSVIYILLLVIGAFLGSAPCLSAC